MTIKTGKRGTFARRILALALVMCMALSLVPTAAFAQTAQDVQPAAGGTFTSVGPAQGVGVTYYVDGGSGSDDADGKTPQTAWQSLNKVTATTFSPGDRILLRASSVWNGQMLYPKGNGTRQYPIVVDLYDMQDGTPVYTADKRPVINGNGTQGIGTKKTIISGAVMTYNQEGWEFRNLEVTNSEDLSNRDQYKKPGSHQRAGILAYSDIQDRLMDHLVIKDCYVHDVQTQHFEQTNPPKETGVGGMKAAGGIIILGHHLDPNGKLVAAERGKSRAAYRNVLIEGNFVQRVGLEGIRTKCNSDTSMSGNTFFKMFEDVIIQNNYLEEIAGDGIVLTEVAKGGYVLNNVAIKPCNADYGAKNYAGIWSMYSDDAIFRYNECYGIVFGYNDAEAFDIDLSSVRNVYEYNYSHHNSGGFFLFMGDQRDSVVRYNVSANDGFGNKGVCTDSAGHGFGSNYTYDQQSIFHVWSKVDNATMPTVYNNTFYSGSGKTSLFGETGSGSATGTIVRFYNNILVKEGTGHLYLAGNHPSNGNPGVEVALAANPEKYFRNNVIWPESLVTAKSGATVEKLTESGNIFADPKLVYQTSATYADQLEAQRTTTHDPSEDIYAFTSAEALRSRAEIFKITEESPAVGSGLYIGQNLIPVAPCETDLFGTPIAGKVPDIGAHQLSNSPYTTRVKSIVQPDTVQVLAGYYPALPRQVDVVFEDVRGSSTSERTESRNVIWDFLALEQYTNAGTYTLYGNVEGVTDTEDVEPLRAQISVKVTGSAGEGKFEQTFAAVADSFLQDNKKTDADAQGGLRGQIQMTQSTDYYKHPYQIGLTNNFALKIKNASSAGYNRRFVIQFNLADFDGDWSSVKKAGIRLHIARYDSWNSAPGSTNDQKVRNTALPLDVYALPADEAAFNELTVNWSMPYNLRVHEENYNNTLGYNQPPPYDTTPVPPVSHMELTNGDVILNEDTIDIDVAEYLRGLDNDVQTVGFLVALPHANISGYNRDNNGFDAFSKEGAAAMYELYNNTEAFVLSDGTNANIQIRSGSNWVNSFDPTAVSFKTNMIDRIDSPTALAPQLVVSDKYEKGVAQLTVSTRLGVVPELPTEAVLEYSDGSTAKISPVWNTIPVDLYSREGTFQVVGYSGQTNFPILATVTVVADELLGFDAIEPLHVKVGLDKYDLGRPTQATATLKSGETGQTEKVTVKIVSWEDSAIPYSATHAPNPTDGYVFSAVYEAPAGAIVKTEDKPSVTVYTHYAPAAVTMGGYHTVAPGGSAKYAASVTEFLDEKGQVLAGGTDDTYSNKLLWSVTTDTGAAVEGLSIAEDGTVTVGEEVPEGSYRVTATAALDNSVNAEQRLYVKEAKPYVDSVSVSPATAELKKGRSQQFTATVEAGNGADDTVSWSVTGSVNAPGSEKAATAITPAGLLTVGEDETATTLIVRAVSNFDESRSASATVTLLEDGAPAVLSVSIAPKDDVKVKQGESAAFTAEVQVENGAGTDVRWSVAGATRPGTAIGDDGVLQVDLLETAATLTVTATAVADISKSDSATVTVLPDETPRVLAVRIVPAALGVKKGATATLTAEVDATNGADTAVTWALAPGATAQGTAIGADGVLSVAADEEAASLTVTAASVADPAKTATATVTVLAPDVPAVYSVKLSAAAESVRRGGTLAFTAEVTGDAEADKTVSYTLEGQTDADTAIGADGVLSVALGESAKQLTVTAAATANPAISDSVSVAVTAPAPVVTGVEELAAITKPVGTPKAELGLPARVNASLQTGDSLSLPVVDWSSSPEFDPDSESTFTFTGYLDLSGVPDLTNPEGLTASVEVTLIRPVSKEMLTALLAEAEAALESGQVDRLVPSKKQAFEEAYTLALAAQNDPIATDMQVKTAYEALLKAVWDLSYIRADIAELTAAVELYKDLDTFSYTAESARRFKNALDTALALAAFGPELSVADQENIDAAVAALHEAFAALVEGDGQQLGDKTKLRALYNQASITPQTGYEAATVAALNTALLNAESVLAKELAADWEVADAVARLNEALAGLRADKTALAAAIAKHEGTAPEGYDAASWAAFEAALAEARRVNGLELATPIQVSAALNTLNSAAGALRVDTTALRRLVDTVAAFEQKDYDTDSWTAFAAALAAAKQVLASDAPTAAEVQNALAALNAAADALKPAPGVVNKAGLTLLYTSMSTVTRQNYTDKSWQAFQTALSYARSILDKAGASAAEVAKAERDLQRTHTALERQDADKARLTVLHSTWKDLQNTEGKYTAGSWMQLQNALNGAAGALADETLTQAEIDAAYDVLQQATAALVELTALRAAIAQAENPALIEANFTPGSWAVLQQALAAGRTALADPALTADAAQNAADALHRAVLALARVANTAPLQARLSEILAESLSEETYTPITYAALKAAIADAQQALADLDVLQTRVNRALSALNTARTALRERADVEKLALEMLLADCDQMVKERYTTASWAAMQKAAAAARALLEEKGDELTKGDPDLLAAYVALEQAVVAMVVKVADIALQPHQLTLFVGAEKALTATLKPDDATDRGITYTTSNAKVATVTENGTVKAVAPGTAVITAAGANGKSAVCTVEVKQLAGTITLGKTHIAVERDSTQPVDIPFTLALKDDVKDAQIGFMVLNASTRKERTGLLYASRPYGASVVNVLPVEGSVAEGASAAAILRVYLLDNPDIYAECRVEVVDTAALGAGSKAAAYHIDTPKVTVYTRSTLDVPVMVRRDAGESILPLEQAGNTFAFVPAAAKPNQKQLDEAALLNTVFSLIPSGENTLMLHYNGTPEGAKLKASYSTKVRLTGAAGIEMTLPEALTITVNAKPLALKAGAVSINTFYDERTADITFTGGTVTALRRDDTVTGSKQQANENMLAGVSPMFRLEGTTLTAVQAGAAGKTNGTLYLLADVAGWGEVPVSVKVSAESKAPAIKPSAATVKLFEDVERSAGAQLKLLPKTGKAAYHTLGVSEAYIVPATALAGKDATTYKIQDKLALEFDRGTGTITLTVKGGETKVPTGKLLLGVRFTGSIREVRLPLSVTPVKATTKLKLTPSVKALSLNQYLSGGESASVSLKASIDDYVLDTAALAIAVTDAKTKNSQWEAGEEPLTAKMVDDRLVIATTENTPDGQTYNVTAQDPASGAVATVKVTTMKSASAAAVTATLGATGKLNLTTGAAATVTVTFKNYNGQYAKEIPFTIADSEGYAMDMASFAIEKTAPNTWRLALADAAYTDPDLYVAPGTYQLMARGALETDRREVRAKVARLTVEATSPAAKLSASKVTLRTADRYSEGIVQLSLPAGCAPVRKVEIASGKISGGYDIHAIGGGAYAIGFKNDKVASGIKGGALTLNVYLEGNPKHATTVKVTVQLAK